MSFQFNRAEEGIFRTRSNECEWTNLDGSEVNIVKSDEGANWIGVDINYAFIHFESMYRKNWYSVMILLY